MNREENLKALLSQQRKITDELEREVLKLNSEGIVRENDLLKDELAKCSTRLGEADRHIGKLTQENQRLKNLLYEQIYNEKLTILNTVNNRVETYFQGNINGEINRLKFFEFESRRRIDEMTNILISYRISSEDEIFARLNELGGLLNHKITEAMRILNEQSGRFMQDRNAEYQKLSQEGVTDTEAGRILKKNNIESLIGLNILNKLGILLVIIGVIAAAQFTYLRLPDIFKAVLMFAGGAVLLLAGELLNRRKPNVFSLGITSGGVAVLYVALAVSYFGLEVTPMYPALAICIAITALSFFLSQRYNSQTIAAFSFVGGYLPIFSISADRSLVYSAMVYFVILNLLSLIIAFRRKWFVTAVIGFVLNILGSVYIMSLTLDIWKFSDRIKQGDVITAVYIIFVFLIYTLVPLVSAYSAGKKLSEADLALIAANTCISAVLLYIIFLSTGLTVYKGLLAVVFAAAYFAFARLVRAKLPAEKRIRTLFYLTSFAFTVLIVPLQFDRYWLSLGWLVEGLLMLLYGILKEDKRFRKYGFIVSGLCLAAFLFFDIEFRIFGNDRYFTWKYFSVTLGSLIIMAAYIIKKQLSGLPVKALKYCTYINLWFFLLYIIIAELSGPVKQALGNSDINADYLLRALCITAGFLLAFTAPRIKATADTGMKIISACIYILSILWLSLINTAIHVTSSYAAPVTTLIAAFIIVIINVLSILSAMDLMKYLVQSKKLGAEWYPLTVSVYFVIILTQNLISQYHLGLTSFVISIIYITLAFSWIIFGFVKKYSFIRRFGLGLSFLSVAKLFLVDLSFLTEGYRIISYFSFGFVLIAISFVYQYFNKRLDVKI